MISTNRGRAPASKIPRTIGEKRVMPLNALAVLAAAVVLPFAGAADIGPKPLDYAGHPTPLGDMKGIEVEMASEDVKLVLSPGKLEVEAVFHMVNHGADVEFEEGFPVGPFKSMTAFSIEMDGKAAPFKLVDRASSDPRLDRSKEANPDYFGGKGGRREKVADFWYVWNAPFRKGGRHVHTVRYTVGLDHQHFYKQTGYVLHTGAAWKNPIGKAVVTLTFGKGFGPMNLRQFSPLEGARLDGDRVVWTFEKFEPGKEHDLRIGYSLASWKDEIEQLRKEAPRSWSVRRGLQATLKALPSYQGRKAFTPEELGAYLDALSGLISEGRMEDGKFVLPATDPEHISGPADAPPLLDGFMRSRYYVLESSPAETFGALFDEALAAAREHPGDARAKKVLGEYRDFIRRLLAGELHLDYRPLAQNAKLAAERGIRISGRPDPKEGKIVPADRVSEEEAKELKVRLAEAEPLLR